MGLLNRLIENDESAAEKIDRLRKRENDLQGQLSTAQNRLDELERLKEELDGSREPWRAAG